MKETEIIIINNIPPDKYIEIARKSVRYSIISFPFTINRMHIEDIGQRIINIAKGKIAELLFYHFCSENNLPVNYEICTTPFWEIDQRDFVLNQSEWDIKNNYIYHTYDVLTTHKYTNLPALVPNRMEGDQWTNRNSPKIKNCSDTKFLFTFLKGADLTEGKRTNAFLEIFLTKEQESFLLELSNRYKGLPQTKLPFTVNGFWDQMHKRGKQDLFRLHYNPSLIITGYASGEHWEKFRNTGPNDNGLNFKDYIQPAWYKKTEKGSLNFLQNTLWTTITNATCPVSSLPSFLSLFPELKKEMKCGYVKK